jgi:hypothetical protein
MIIHVYTGAAQRWVRECDTESFSNAAVLTASAALSAALGSKDEDVDNKKDCANEEIDNVWRPSYAMGSMACVGLNSDSEMFRKRTMSIRLLHAVIKAMQPTTSTTSSARVSCIATKVDCIRHPSFQPPPSDGTLSNSLPVFYAPADASAYLSSRGVPHPSPTSRHFHAVLLPRGDFMRDHVKVVSHVVGALRRPPSEHDLRIYMTSPNAIRFQHRDSDSSGDSAVDVSAPRATRHDVPGVPGSFLMTNVLTADECAQFILAAEHIGYIPDAVDGIDNVQWLADPSILNTVLGRCSHLLPPYIDGHALGGINAKFRLFRCQIISCVKQCFYCA